MALGGKGRNREDTNIIIETPTTTISNSYTNRTKFMICMYGFREKGRDREDTDTTHDGQDD